MHVLYNLWSTIFFVDNCTVCCEAGATLQTNVLPGFGLIKKSDVVYYSYMHSKGNGLQNSSVCMFTDPGKNHTDHTVSTVTV